MYVPLNIHTHYSLLRGFTKPDSVAETMSGFGMPAAAITDFDSLSGTVAFYKAMTDACIKPILGTKIFVLDEESGISGYVTILAMNFNGWKEMVAISSLSYSIKDDVPAVTFGQLSTLKNCIVMSGEPESILVNAIVARKLVYTSANPMDYTSYFLHENYIDRIKDLLIKFKSTFGERFFSAIQRVNQYVCPIDRVIADIITDYSKLFHIERVGVPNIYYNEKSEAELHSMLLCSHAKKTWNDMGSSIESEEYANMYRFMNGSDCYNISEDDMYKLYTDDEVENSGLIASMCGHYSILAAPSLPDFKCPESMSNKDYLLHLCRSGWMRLKDKLDNKRKDEYTERIKNELSVFAEANLEGYFLIVQDIVNWAKKQGMLVGCSRGSAGGCMVSYLLGITSIDPVIYDLYFERFYNKGRNSGGKISLPDIDVDFPVARRPDVIQYIRDTYGEENVAQVATFSRLQGKGALKAVFRIYEACDKDTSDKISKYLPDESEIADKLEEAKEKSIIRWTLMNEPRELESWCRMDDNGNLSGDMAQYFDKAIRIEGTFNSYGKHASAVIISNSPVASVCPMIRDKKTGAPITAIEYEELESMGLPKFDILGTTVLDKLMGVNALLRGDTVNNSGIEDNDE